MKTCGKCHKNQEDSEFYKKNDRKESSSYCKTCLYVYQKQRWIDRKFKAVELLGGKCSICGYNKCLDALEFHHLDPSKKEFAFNKMRLISWPRMIKELKKCILLCANCHRETHYQEKTYGNSESNKLQKIELKPTGTCLTCKVDVYGTKYCSYKCAQLGRRKVKRPTKDVLKQELSKYSMEALGRKYNVSGKAIRKWAEQYELEFGQALKNG